MRLAWAILALLVALSGCSDAEELDCGGTPTDKRFPLTTDEVQLCALCDTKIGRGIVRCPATVGIASSLTGDVTVCGSIRNPDRLDLVRVAQRCFDCPAEAMAVDRDGVRYCVVCGALRSYTCPPELPRRLESGAHVICAPMLLKIGYDGAPDEPIVIDELEEDLDGIVSACSTDGGEDDAD